MEAPGTSNYPWLLNSEHFQGCRDVHKNTGTNKQKLQNLNG